MGRAILSVESGAIFLDKDGGNNNNGGKPSPKDILENVNNHCDDIIKETSNFRDPPLKYGLRFLRPSIRG